MAVLHEVASSGKTTWLPKEVRSLERLNASPLWCLRLKSEDHFHLSRRLSVNYIWLSLQNTTVRSLELT